MKHLKNRDLFLLENKNSTIEVYHGGELGDNITSPLFVTENYYQAATYGDKVYKFDLDLNNKILDLTDIKTFRNVKSKIYDNHSKLYKKYFNIGFWSSEEAVEKDYNILKKYKNYEEIENAYKERQRSDFWDKVEGLDRYGFNGYYDDSYYALEYAKSDNATREDKEFIKEFLLLYRVYQNMTELNHISLNEFGFFFLDYCKKNGYAAYKAVSSDSSGKNRMIEYCVIDLDIIKYKGELVKEYESFIIKESVHRSHKFFNTDVKIGEYYNESDIYSYIQRIHHDYDDAFIDGDLGERIEEYESYVVEEVNIDDIEIDEFLIDETLVEEYKDILKENKRYPIITLSDEYRIIDGTHRVNALDELGYNTVIAFVGVKGKIMENKIYIKFKDYIKESNSNINDNFYKWFDDSKIVDESGLPKIMYHGSEHIDKIDIFKNPKGYHFFTDNKSEALRYTGGKFDDLSRVNKYYIKAEKIFDPQNLSESIKNKVYKLLNDNKDYFISLFPKEYLYKLDEIYDDTNFLTNIEQEQMDKSNIYGWIVNNIDHFKLLKHMFKYDLDNYIIIESDLMQNLIKNNGFDSFLTLESGGDLNIAVYNSNQIKSVNNDGSWDINDDDIYS